MRKEASKIASFALVACIVLFLVLSGPANAFNLNINFEKPVVEKGEITSFVASVSIDSGERMQINYLNLQLIGPETVNCKFLVNGTAISGCKGLSIKPEIDASFTNGNLSASFHGINYNFGYGYGYSGVLSYNISMNTSLFSSGVYNGFLKIKAEGKPDLFSEQAGNITIIKPVLIENISSSLPCSFADSDLKVSASIHGSIKRVIVSLNANGSWVNMTLPGTAEGTYSYKIPNSILVSGENITWRFVVEDIGGGHTYSALNSYYISRHTTVSIEPSEPQGLNGWYTSEPEITLSNPDSTNISYKWDALKEHQYSGPFGVEDAPNNANVTGGIQVLYYWSDVCNENEQSKTIYLDFANPQITIISPFDNSTVNVLKPTIEALVSDVYGSNSGIVLNKIVLTLDGKNVTPSVSASYGGYLVKYTPTTALSIGIHNVSLYAMDYSGRQSSLSWKFAIGSLREFNMNIYEPFDKISDERKAQVNITTSSKATISYINYNENRPREIILCRNCIEYGNIRKRELTLKEGNNTLGFKAVDEFGNVKIENRTIFVDSIAPQIQSTEPRRNAVINGSMFSIKYSEDNLRSIALVWDGETKLMNCSSGKNMNCSTSADLSAFDGKYINFYFNVSDIARTEKSRETRVLVDTTSPQLKMNALNGTYTRKIPINATVSEKATLEYYDDFDSIPRWRYLCSNCNDYGNARAKFISLRPGVHNILLRARDAAGNSDAESFSVNVR